MVSLFVASLLSGTHMQHHALVQTHIRHHIYSSISTNVATTTRRVRTNTKPATVLPSVPQSATVTTAITNGTFAAQVENAIHIRINAERSKAGLQALMVSTPLAAVARAHSADMATNNYFAHTNPQGCTASCRMTKAGIPWRSMGENIYMMQGIALTADQTAKKVVGGWMSSPGHRANILTKAFATEGIGVYQKGTLLEITEDFALLR